LILTAGYDPATGGNCAVQALKERFTINSFSRQRPGTGKITPQALLPRPKKEAIPRKKDPSPVLLAGGFATRPLSETRVCTADVRLAGGEISIAAASLTPRIENRRTDAGLLTDSTDAISLAVLALLLDETGVATTGAVLAPGVVNSDIVCRPLRAEGPRALWLAG